MDSLFDITPMESTSDDIEIRIKQFIRRWVTVVDNRETAERELRALLERAK